MDESESIKSSFKFGNRKPLLWLFNNGWGGLWGFEVRGPDAARTEEERPRGILYGEFLSI